MKYFVLLSKQIFLSKNNEIADSPKKPFIQTHTHTFTKLDNSTTINNTNADNISNHISYLHKKHTEEIIHDKETEQEEESSFGFHICMERCRAFCKNVYDKIILFPKY